MTSLPIPTSEAQYGYVVGRVIRAIADGMDDDDKPDMQAATGTVTFTPKARLGRTSDYRAFVVREPIVCPLNVQGYLTSQIKQYVALTVGVYEVSFQLGAGAAISSFPVEVTAAHTQAAPLDLVTAAPYSPPAGAVVQTMLVPAGAAVGQVLSWTASGLGWVDVSARGLIITSANVASIPAGTTADNLAAYYNSSTSPITVAGVELAAGSHAVWAWVSGAWVQLAGGTSTPSADTSDATPPVWAATLTTGIATGTSVVISASALATDNVAVTGYRWRLSSEDAGVARPITPSGLNFTIDGLTPSTGYAAPILWAVDAGGNKSAELVAQGFATAAGPKKWTRVFYDTFTAPDGTLLTAHTPEQGSWAEGTAKIYGGKIRRKSVAESTSCEARSPVAGAVTRGRITADIDRTGASSDSPRFRIGFDAASTATMWVNIFPNGSVSAGSWFDHTFVETSGLTTPFPLTGTLGVEADLDARTLKATLNGALLRSWNVTIAGDVKHIMNTWVDIGQFVEDSAPSSVDNFTCEVWQ